MEVLREVEPERDQVQEVAGVTDARGVEAVAAWLASGEELKSYCERTGQSVWSLRKWRREHAERFGIEIKRRTGEMRPERSGAVSSMIPIQLVGPAAAMAGSMTIEVRVGKERSIVLPAQIDSATVTRLILAVEAAR